MFLAMTSVIAMTRSPLQASISSTGGQFVAFICKGRGTSRSSYEDSDSLSSMVTERNSRTLGDDSVSIAIADPMYWELEDFECFSGKLWEGGFIKINDESQQLIQAIGLRFCFNG